MHSPILKKDKESDVSTPQLSLPVLNRKQGENKFLTIIKVLFHKRFLPPSNSPWTQMLGHGVGSIDILIFETHGTQNE